MATIPFRLMTYNILDGGGPRREAITDIIRHHAPDVVILPEVMQVEVLEQMARALSMTWRVGGGTAKGRKVGLLSRLPILNTRTRRLAGRRHGLATTVQLSNAQKLTVCGLHLIPFHTWPFECRRQLELRRLLAWLNQTEATLPLLAGDVNAIAPADEALMTNAPVWVKAQTWPQGGKILRFALKTLFNTGYIDAYRRLHPAEAGFTLPAAAPEVRLDYIFVPPALQASLRSCAVAEEPDAVRTASDHLPVVADFEFGN